MGPGLTGEIPIFNRNQGGKARAAADIERASRLYAAARAQVIADVRSPGVRVSQAQQSTRGVAAGDIVPSLETELRQAESAYNAGETPLFTVLDVSRRLVDSRMRQLDAEAGLQSPRIALERAHRPFLPLKDEELCISDCRSACRAVRSFLLVWWGVPRQRPRREQRRPRTSRRRVPKPS